MSRKGATRSSTTCPRTCPRCSTRGRRSGARRSSGSSTPTSTARSPISTTSCASSAPSWTGEVEPAPELPPDARQAEELGDLLFAAVNVARRLNVDPELELRRATQRFVARVERAQALAAGDDHDWTKLPLDDQDRYFDLAKESE